MPQQNEGPLQSSKAEGKRHKGSLEKVFFSKSETDKEKIDFIIIIILTSYLEQPFSKKKGQAASLKAQPERHHVEKPCGFTGICSQEHKWFAPKDQGAT